MLEAITANIIAWRMPQSYPSGSITWAVLAVPGTLLLGHGLNGILFGGATLINPFVAAFVGLLTALGALLRANHPDWMLRSWPEPGAIPRFERHGS